jgi:hypothetical protein
MLPSCEELETLSDREIGSKYGCSTRTVQRWRKKLGVKRPGWGPGKLDMEKACEIRRLYFEEGKTQQELADMFGVSQAAIGRVVNNITYKERTLGLGGESPCSVNYRVD